MLAATVQRNVRSVMVPNFWTVVGFAQKHFNQLRNLTLPDPFGNSVLRCVQVRHVQRIGVVKIIVTRLAKSEHFRQLKASGKF
jgi:hypothetical protein